MIAIVPARGGSKGLLKKNIKDFYGKPLIYYTITEAIKSSLISDVILSTDSKEIADIAAPMGAQNYFYRPGNLAADNAKAIDNYLFTIKKLNDEFDYNIKEFVVLQPTSPLRRAKDIDEAVNLFKNKNADSVVSVCDFDHPLEWAKKIDDDGRIQSFFDDADQNLNRQDLPTAYRPNGAIFVFRYDLLLKTYSYYSPNTFAYIMDKESSIDIDTQFDFDFAEFCMRKRNERSK